MASKTKLANDIASSTDNESAVYAIAGRLDVQSRLLARQLHEAGKIYIFYGLLDGLNLSYLTLKNLFDIIFTNSKTSSSDAMHEWTLTPTGILVAATESITLIVFSMLANHFKDSDKNLLKRYIAITWPYIRDSLKGLKNIYKGVRSTIQVANLLSGSHLNLLILPVGLTLSVLSISNRIWFRHMVNLRKNMMKANAILLASIEDNGNLTVEDYKRIRNQIYTQINEVKNRHRLAYASTAFNGTVDSLYYYMGILTLCSFNWPLLVGLTALCILYCIACIATRIYEEYDNQRKLKITQLEIDLALFIKENTSSLQANFARLQEISELIALGNKSKALLEEQDKLTANIKLTLLDFKNKRDHLKSLATLSPLEACLEGMRHGLAAYSALSCVIFAISTIVILTTATFPPALIISCISAGIIFLAGFVAYSMYQHYKHRTKDEVINDKPYEKLNEMLRDLKQIQQRSATNVIRETIQPEKRRNFKEEVKDVINDGKKVPSAPEFIFQQWFETIRTFFSGLTKGPKATGYVLNPLQELASDGHYHDAPIMVGISFIASALYAFTLALRNHARSFGRPPFNQTKRQDKINSSLHPPPTSFAKTDKSPPSPPQVAQQIKEASSLPNRQESNPSQQENKKSILAENIPENTESPESSDLTQIPSQQFNVKTLDKSRTTLTDSQSPQKTQSSYFIKLFNHANQNNKDKEKTQTTDKGYVDKQRAATTIETVELRKNDIPNTTKLDAPKLKKTGLMETFRLGTSHFSLFSKKESFVAPGTTTLKPG
ncbi:hypothetical protein ACNVED_00650 [Legionella sp. D16C41]|uniref:hypothetical protein n=1 Tax=Legionella sp. D16C41 TaxID=3402688 RepID=UPI003AF45AA7